MTIETETGVIAWFSLMATDISAANAYYLGLHGWDSKEIEVPGMGKAQVYSAAGREFGGPVALDAQHGIPSHWISYFAVPDVDTSCRQLVRLGGTVCYQPFDMPGFGRSSVVQDPEGNVFHLFSPASATAQLSVSGDAPGQPCWLELMVDDMAAAQHFYGQLLGWSFNAHEGAELPYAMASHQQGMVGGIMQKPPEMGMLPPAWLPYFMVPQLAPAMARAEQLGGEKIFGPSEVDDIGRLALYQDPAGAFAYLFEPAPSSQAS
jgi:predicted enzyme related to lactoylglutathione lyase